jgi:hypothetical protein
MDPIVTDRPDQTESAATVPVGYLQGEHGVSVDISTYIKQYAAPATLLRYGINNTFEMRVALETQVSSLNSYGVLPLAIGIKSRLISCEAMELSLITHLQFADIASQEYKTLHNALQTRLTAAHTLTDFWSLGYNFGLEWDGTNPSPWYVYTCTNGFSLGERLGFFAEVFGSFQPSVNEASADAGFTYLITNNFQFDIAGGYTFDGGNVFAGLGFAYRVNTRPNNEK